MEHQEPNPALEPPRKLAAQLVVSIVKVIVMTKIDRDKMNRDLYIAHLRSILSSQFEEFRDYFESVQSLLKSEEKRISDWIKREAAKVSPEERDQFGELYADDYWKFKGSFPAIQRNSVFISIYSEFEDVLKFICTSLGKKNGSVIETYKWRGGILERTKACLEEDIGIEMSSIISYLNEIIEIRKIRNALVHGSGWLYDREEADAKTIDWITNKWTCVNLEQKGDGFYRLVITDKFVISVIDTFDQFLKELLSSISDWVNRKC